MTAQEKQEPFERIQTHLDSQDLINKYKRNIETNEQEHQNLYIERYSSRVLSPVMFIQVIQTDHLLQLSANKTNIKLLKPLKPIVLYSVHKHISNAFLAYVECLTQLWEQVLFCLSHIITKWLK